MRETTWHVVDVQGEAAVANEMVCLTVPGMDSGMRLSENVRFLHFHFSFLSFK